MVRSLINTAREVLGPVLELLYPTRCGGCGGHGEVLCRTCRSSFCRPDRSSACPICGRQTGRPVVCGACMQHRQCFEAGYYGFSFEGRAREALHAFKFQGRKDVGRALVHLLDEEIGLLAPAFDVVIPLPVTEKRLKKRGFNQSFLIAEEIARLTGKAVDCSTLRKVKETEDQYLLSREERKKNIRGAFDLTGGAALKGRRLLLVDDLYTTGNTAREACRILLRARPGKVLFFALARTPG